MANPNDQKPSKAIEKTTKTTNSSKKPELSVSEKKAIKTFFDAIQKFMLVYDENKDYTFSSTTRALSKSAEKKKKEYEYLKKGINMLLGKKTDTEIGQIANAIKITDKYKLIHFVRRNETFD